MSRTIQQRLLLAVGAVALAAATFGAYAHSVLADSSTFADRTADAIGQPEVRAELTEAIVDEMVAAAPELISVQPLLTSIVDGVLSTDVADALLRAATEDLHRTLFTDADDTVILQVSELILVAKAQVTALDPELGALIPDDLTDTVIEVRERASAIDLAQFAAGLDTWNLVVTAIAVAALVAALWRSRDGSTGLVGVGFALMAAAMVAVVLALAARWWFVDRTAPIARVVWDAFFDSFDAWIVGLGGLGATLAAIAWFGVSDPDVGERWERLRHLARRRDTRAERVAWGAIAIVLGLLVVLNTTTVVRLAAGIVGVFAIVAGAREVLVSAFPSLATGLSLRRSDTSSTTAHRPRTAPVGKALASTLVVGLALVGAMAVTRGRDGDATPPPSDGCNGSQDWCSLRLNEITLAATHNSHAAAAAGFLNGYQLFGIEQQLADGIRGLLIDVYFGFDDGGRVITDRAPLTPDERDDLVADVGESAVAAAEATRSRFEASGVTADLYLCHALCEIGATRFVDELRSIKRFLDDHPREVIVVIIQDEGPSPADIAAAFDDSGLIDLVHTQRIDEPFPTLGEMVDRNERLFVTAENRAGEFDWYHDAFTFVQDTSYSYGAADEFDCDINRGSSDSPLLLVNHWLSPVSPRAADDVNRASVLTDRVEECQEARSMTPNLIAVDFYDRGELMAFVDETR